MKALVGFALLSLFCCILLTAFSIPAPAINAAPTPQLVITLVVASGLL